MTHQCEPWMLDDSTSGGRYCRACGAPATCDYSTSIDRPCGRPATSGPHCDFHAMIAQLDTYDFHNPAPITVPASVRPLVDRILSDVQANLDVMPCPPVADDSGDLT